MRKINHCVVAALLSACAVSRSFSAQAATPAIYDLDTVGGLYSYGTAVNSNAQTTGIVATAVGAPPHAFLYSGVPGGGTMFDLGTLGGTQSAGYGINSQGQVTGYSDKGGNLERHAFRYSGIPGSGGTMADLGTLDGGLQSYGYAINAAGQVAGYSTLNDSLYRHAFRYSGIPGSGGAMIDLGTLGGQYSEGYGINSNGQVAGNSSLTGAAGGGPHAFLYSGTPGSGGTMSDLGTLGGTESYGYAVNDSGQVTGYSKVSGDAAIHAFLYSGTPGSGGTMADLGTLGGAGSIGHAINAGGQIVGESGTPVPNTAHAFLYLGAPGAGGHMIDLDAWLDANNPVEGAKWTLVQGFGLSDNGLVTGFGDYNDGPGGLVDGSRAFLLDASALVVPEPAGFVLLGLGGVGLLLWRALGKSMGKSAVVIELSARGGEGRIRGHSTFSATNAARPEVCFGHPHLAIGNSFLGGRKPA